MPGATSALYEPLLERRLDAIPEAVRAYLAAHSLDELYLAVARFAVLAYAPSQHGKHAVLACLAAHDLRDAYGARFGDLLVECARYAAESRQPWSEPPILTPADVDEGPAGIDELRAAVAEGDRLRGERWLAHNVAAPHDLWTVAADGFDDLGDAVVVVHAAFRLIDVLGEQGRHALLRMAVWELTSTRRTRYEERGHALPERELLARIVATMSAQRGSIESGRLLLLFAAAAERARVRDYLTSQVAETATASDLGSAVPEPPVYRLSRDYAALLETHAAAKRLATRFPDVDLAPAIMAAHENLRTADFAEWSFA